MAEVIAPIHATGRDAASATVARRFWTLLLLVLFLAVTSSALAVRHTATPFLTQQQRDAVSEQAWKHARNLDAILSRHHLLLSFVAGDAKVYDVVMGYSENIGIVGDYLESLPSPDALDWVALYDVFGETLSRRQIRDDEHSLFGEAELRALVRDYERGEPGAERRVLLRVDDRHAHIVLAAPVGHGGFVEGVIVGGFSIDPAEVFPDSEIAEATHVVKQSYVKYLTNVGPDGSIVVPLDDFDLAVVMTPDHAVTTAAGRSLLTTTVSAIAMVLVAAFALFAWLGRRSIIEPHRKLEAQKQDLAELAVVAERANDAIVVTDLKGRIVWTNPAFETMSGYGMNEVRGRKPGDILQGPDTDPEAVAQIAAALRERRPEKTEILNYAKTGEPYWISISITPLAHEGGRPYGFMAITGDVTEARRQREAIETAKLAIEHQALHDALTGLPNRRALDLALRARVGTPSPGATIVRIDLDHFKYVNDTMGHQAGDFVLEEVARILEEETKSDDVPARVGGDEFVILLAAGRTSADGVVVANRMLSRIREPKNFEGKTVRVGASFGVASTGEGLLPLDELIIGADAALYEAKDLGRNRVRLYTPELHRAVLDRRSLAREIRLAIAQEEFDPWFQPQIDARSGRIVGVETLARWNSPQLGLLSPDAFMPVARQLSVIDDIDAIIFRKAVDQIVDLRHEGMVIPKVSFNVTAERIQNEESYAALMENIAKGPQIGFEILESVLVEEQSELFRYSLDWLREAGVSIEVDDFGSGHASIIGLMHLLPDAMKIDQRLVLPIVRDPTRRRLLRQIIGMADILGLKVTAEGVETAEHAAALRDMGCDTFQGYAFARAMPVDELRDYVASFEPFVADANAAPTSTTGRRSEHV